MTLTQAEIDAALTPLYVCIVRALRNLQARAEAEGWEDDFWAGRLHPRAPKPARRPATAHTARKAS